MSGTSGFEGPIARGETEPMSPELIGASTVRDYLIDGIRIRRAIIDSHGHLTDLTAAPGRCRPPTARRLRLPTRRPPHGLFDGARATAERPHRLKTFDNWTVHQTRKGWHWTSPTGRTYLIEPFDYRLGP